MTTNNNSILHFRTFQGPFHQCKYFKIHSLDNPDGMNRFVSCLRWLQCPTTFTPSDRSIKWRQEWHSFVQLKKERMNCLQWRIACNKTCFNTSFNLVSSSATLWLLVLLGIWLCLVGLFKTILSCSWIRCMWLTSPTYRDSLLLDWYEL